MSTEDGFGAAGDQASQAKAAVKTAAAIHTCALSPSEHQPGQYQTDHRTRGSGSNRDEARVGSGG